MMIRLREVEFESIDSGSRLSNSATKSMFTKKTLLLIHSSRIEGREVDVNLRKVDTHNTAPCVRVPRMWAPGDHWPFLAQRGARNRHISQQEDHLTGRAANPGTDPTQLPI